MLASVALTVDSSPSDIGCGCPDRCDCPLWCWLGWLGSLALVVEMLASVTLTVDSGPGDAGRGCSERWFSSGIFAALRDAVLVTS